MSEAKKPKEKWETYKAAIPGFRDLIDPPEPVVDDSAADYNNFTDKLPGDVSQQIKTINTEDYEKLLAKKIEHRWCLCDMPEGEFPIVHSYTNLASLVDALAKREGKETAVWVMYGVPLMLSKALTRGSDEEKELYRYLLLPNDQAVIVANKEPFKLLAQSELPDNLEMSDDGWLGDPDFLKSDEYYMPKTIPNDQLSTDPDNDEDDPEAEEPVE